MLVATVRMCIIAFKQIFKLTKAEKEEITDEKEIESKKNHYSFQCCDKQQTKSWFWKS